MAYEGNLQSYPGVVAAGDLSSDQFKFMKIGSSKQAALNTVNGGYVDGVLQNAPAAANRAATVAFDGISKVVAGAVVADGALLMSDATGRAVTAADVATSATKTASAETYDFAAGDTMVLDVDNIGNATCTWDAAAATILDTTVYTGGTAGSITDTTTYAVADQDTLTSLITIDGGSQQTVTFSGATTTAAVVAAQMADQLTGCSVVVTGGQVVITSDSVGVDSSVAAAAGTGGLTWAAASAGTGGLADQDGLTEIVTIDGGDAQTVTFSGVTTEVADVAAQMAAQLIDCKVAVSGGQVLITTDSQGTGSGIVIGTGTCALSWAAQTAGTGDVANINAVTAAEIETVIEADTTALVAVATGVPTITSPTTGITSELEFVSGNAIALLGLSVEVVTGSASDSTIRGRALEAAAAAGDIITMTLAPTGKV